MNKVKGNIFKIIIILLFLAFVALYFASETGYYDDTMRKKTILTEEKIKEFESDVKAGKNVEIADYLTDTEKNYRNNLSNSIVNVSNRINKIFKNGIQSIFKFVDKLVEEE